MKANNNINYKAILISKDNKIIWKERAPKKMPIDYKEEEELFRFYKSQLREDLNDQEIVLEGTEKLICDSWINPNEVVIFTYSKNKNTWEEKRREEDFENLFKFYS